MGGELLGAAWTAGITIVIIFAAIVGIGFWMLARRKSTSPPSDALGSLQQKANILLVRVDDAIKNAEDEVAFALAQFGDVKSQEFDTVLVAAKGQLREAFGLQQKLDDAYPDTETQRRDWSGRIIHLCETAQASLDTQERNFAELRELEKNAPKNLNAVRTALDAVDTHVNTTTETLATLSSHFSPHALSSIADNIERAATERQDASGGVDHAEKLLSHAAATGTGTGTGSAGASSISGSSSAATDHGTAVIDLIRSAGEHTFRAKKLLDAVDALQDELTKTRDAVLALRDSTRTNLAEARAVRDAPPDPDAGAAVGRAIQTVESALTADPDVNDPMATLEILRAANAELDASMAGARNQKQRLDGARTALVGALVGARSQLKATQNFIDNRRGGVGSGARTRLAEAERLLTVAEVESDPVAALDTARSSATYSRDADALARFDLMGR